MDTNEASLPPALRDGMAAIDAALGIDPRSLTREQLEELVVTMVHDLRTPLQSVLTYAEELERQPQLAAEVRQKYLATVLRCATVLKDMVDDLAASLLHPGTSRGEAVDVAAALERCVQSQLLPAAQMGVTFSVSASEAPAAARIDPSHLERLLANLLSNAVKHAPRGGGVVRARVHVSGDEVQVVVSDNGAGIAPEVRRRLFQKWAAGSRGGHGLGLHIARGLAKRYGGRIWAADAPGGGAIFGFALPRARAD